jgi:hypothetical protein
MSQLLDPFRFVLIALSGWMNSRQSLLIDYLREENCVLREQCIPIFGRVTRTCRTSTGNAISISCRADYPVMLAM